MKFYKNEPLEKNTGPGSPTTPLGLTKKLILNFIIISFIIHP